MPVGHYLGRTALGLVLLVTFATLAFTVLSSSFPQQVLNGAQDLVAQARALWDSP